MSGTNLLESHRCSRNPRAFLDRRSSFWAADRRVSDYMTFLTQPGYEKQVATAIYRSIQKREFRALFGKISMIELEGHLESDTAISHFASLAKNENHSIVSQQLEGTWRVEMPEDWETFRSQVIKKSQRRKVNKVAKYLASNEFQVEYTAKLRSWTLSGRSSSHCIKNVAMSWDNQAVSRARILRSFFSRRPVV